MSMDLTAAKGVLQRVAEQYKAARDLGDALEALTNLEQQGNMLGNNVENLQKEQARLTADQAAMRQSMTDEGGRIRAEHAKLRADLLAQRTTLMQQIQATKDTATQDALARAGTVNAAIANEEARLQSLQAERATLEQQVSGLGRQLDEIKSKMREFVG